MSTALATIETVTTITASELFKPNALELILDRIEAQAREEAASLDISTEPNRKALASLAYKIARSKTYIDDQGKTLTEDARKQIDAVNAERKTARDRLDVLKDEIRKPLTDWEQADNDRIAVHEAELKVIEGAGTYTAQNWQKLSSEAIADRIREIETDNRDWQEFNQRAAGVKAVAINLMRQALADAEKLEAERAEMKRLREEEQERAIKEREAAAARAATEAAEKKAQEQAEAAQRAAQAERERLQREAEYAEQKRIAAEQEVKRQVELAEARRIEAEAKAKRDQEAAIERERQRVAEEAARERAAAEKRASHARHVAKVHRVAAAALETHCQLEPGAAEVVVAAIAKGLIPHVNMEY